MITITMYLQKRFLNLIFTPAKFLYSNILRVCIKVNKKKRKKCKIIRSINFEFSERTANSVHRGFSGGRTRASESLFQGRNRSFSRFFGIILQSHFHFVMAQQRRLQFQQLLAPKFCKNSIFLIKETSIFKSCERHCNVCLVQHILSLLQFEHCDQNTHKKRNNNLRKN